MLKQFLLILMILSIVSAIDAPISNLRKENEPSIKKQAAGFDIMSWGQWITSSFQEFLSNLEWCESNAEEIDDWLEYFAEAQWSDIINDFMYTIMK